MNFPRPPRRFFRAQVERSRRAFEPRLEPVERRTLLSGMTYTVNSIADAGTGSGLSGDLRYAITQADSHPGSTINFSVTGTITLTKALPDLSADVSINGPGASLMNVVGTRATTFTVDGGVTASISGMAITGDGGPIYEGSGIVNKGTLTLTSINLSNNSGGYGGGIDNTGTLTLTKSTVSGNTAAFGGGLFNSLSGTSTVSDCNFSGNTAKLTGGAITSKGGVLILTDSTLTGNTGQKGGGLYTIGGAATVTGCTISGNSGRYGGGIRSGGLYAPAWARSP